jgi:hypothetical protein
MIFCTHLCETLQRMARWYQEHCTVGFMGIQTISIGTEGKRHVDVESPLTKRERAYWEFLPIWTRDGSSHLPVDDRHVKFTVRTIVSGDP